MRLRTSWTNTPQKGDSFQSEDTVTSSGLK